MTLKTTGTCTKIHKKSQSPAFKDLQIGDQIEFSIEIKAVGRNRRSHAAYIICLNPKTQNESKLSFNQIGKTLDCFEFEEINQDYEKVLDEIEAKEPEVFYAGGRWDLYKDGFMDAKREICDLLKKF
ncbi:hypothetical protein FMM74_014360 [Lachnospiraceae bacterium MD308]|nr:hypothetical protein [Lachnospiraceae bacterium MD308]